VIPSDGDRSASTPVACRARRHERSAAANPRRTQPQHRHARLAKAIPDRHTDRRPVSDQPLPAASIDTIAAAQTESRLHIFTPVQALALASAARRAVAVQTDDPRVGAEVASDQSVGLHRLRTGRHVGALHHERAAAVDSAKNTVP
jgi:hypothetical protein